MKYEAVCFEKCLCSSAALMGACTQNADALHDTSVFSGMLYESEGFVFLNYSIINF